MKKSILSFLLIVLFSNASKHYLIELLGQEECARCVIDYVQENPDIRLTELLRLTPRSSFRDLLELEYRRIKLGLNPTCIFPFFTGIKINLFLYVINKLRKRLNDEKYIQKNDFNLSHFMHLDQYIQFYYNLALFYINNSLENSNPIYKRTLKDCLKRLLNLNRMEIIMSLEKFAQQFQPTVLVLLSGGALLPNHSLNIPEFSPSDHDQKLLTSYFKNIRTRKKLVFFIHKVINLLILCLIKTCCSFNGIVFRKEEEDKKKIEEQATNLALLAESEIDRFISLLMQSIHLECSCRCEEGEFIILIHSKFISVNQIDIFTISFPIDASPVTCSMKNKIYEVGQISQNYYIFSIYLNKPNDYRKIVDRLISNRRVLEYREEIEKFIEINL
jgi:hypothetical protein